MSAEIETFFVNCLFVSWKVCIFALMQTKKYWRMMIAGGMLLLLSACGGRQQLKSFNNVITADDSLNIELSKSTQIKYHSESLGLDIEYPSYLRHQFLADEQMEVFMNDDLSLSFMEQQMFKGDDIFRTPGQQLMGMGAELLEAGDDYSIHTGQEGDFEYYAKVIDDSTRLVTIILRYLPDRAEAVEYIKEYVHDYSLRN